MTKFQITVETKQVWRTEVEAETLEQARTIRDNFYELMNEQCEGLELQFQQTETNAFNLIEFYGGDDLSDDDIKALQDLTKMQTVKAFRSSDYVDSAWCPYCQAENSEDIKLGGTDKFSRDFDTDEANAKIFECKCFHCGQMFRVDYFKEV